MNEINHPEHYNKHPSGVECITVVEHFNFNIGNAIKYIWRAGLKSDNPIKDLEKADWYVRREIERLEMEAKRKWAIDYSAGGDSERSTDKFVNAALNELKRDERK